MANTTLCTRNFHDLREISPLRRNAAAISWGCVVCAAAIYAPHAVAQSYPTKAIRMVVAVTPGGSTDVVARIVTQKMADLLAQRFIVDNRPGAGSIVGSDIVAKAAPDGYTLLFAMATHITTPSLYSKLPFNTEEDFQAISLLATQPLVIIVNPQVPVRSIKELITLAKAKPGQLNYGLNATGSAGHVAAEMFKLMTGTEIVAVAYKGAAPSNLALASNEVQLIFANVLSGITMGKSGKAVVIGVASEKRMPQLPDVPTFSEQGIPSFDVAPWQGIVGPKGMPRTVVVALNRAAAESVRSSDVIEKLLATGSTPIGGTPEELDARIKSQLKSWGEVIRKAGMHVN
ncbi:MAG: tripartite tricarboxylate transporter substrate binding protein [Betaproteobacteria bacterium]|nr:tripartite tricarboxylate transporter substrate binding protein [Betaproteobacteria bacterium]